MLTMTRQNLLVCKGKDVWSVGFSFTSMHECIPLNCERQLHLPMKTFTLEGGCRQIYTKVESVVYTLQDA